MADYMSSLDSTIHYAYGDRETYWWTATVSDSLKDELPLHENEVESPYPVYEVCLEARSSLETLYEEVSSCEDDGETRSKLSLLSER